MPHNSNHVLIVGANASLSYSLCQQLAKQGNNLILWGRNKEELSLLAHDLTIRHTITATTITHDLTDPQLDLHAIIDQLPDCEQAYIAVGAMGNGEHDDLNNLHAITAINYSLPASIITLLAQKMDRIGGGSIAVISSVAGDRGRQSNYLYGSAKAALSTFCSGIRHRYASSNTHIMTVKPGFIDTPMTYDMESPLIASRDYVARKIITALAAKKDVIYVPFFWWGIMLIIRTLPEKIFKKTQL